MRLPLFLLVLSSLVCASCTPVLRDVPQDLEMVSTPPSALVPPPPVLPVLPVVPLTSPAFRAWVPREVFPNGDTVEGHYLEIGTAPATPEAVPLPYTIPRVPKQPAPVASHGAKVRYPPKAPEAPPPEGLPGQLPPWVQGVPGLGLPGGTHGLP